MEHGEHTKLKLAEEFYNELFSLQTEEKELECRLKVVKARLEELDKEVKERFNKDVSKSK